MKNTKIIGIVVILCLVFGAGGFYAGMKYQQNQIPQRGQLRTQGQNQQGRFNQGFRPVNGEILNFDDKSITVKLQDGSSKIVILTGTTAINKSAQGSKADLKTGERVAVFGTQNSDGSVTAQNIQINPLNRIFSQRSGNQ